MEAAQSALREGVIYDLLGRQRHADIRDQTVKSLSQRFTVDQQQAKRVRQTALDFLDQVTDIRDKSAASQRQLLGWAADLHEIGMDLRRPFVLHEPVCARAGWLMGRAHTYNIHTASCGVEGCLCWWERVLW